MMNLDELGNARETWCAVELDKAQDWCRTQMKHHKDHFKSTVFDTQYVKEDRCNFVVDDKPRRERRHFEQSYYCQLKI